MHPPYSFYYFSLGFQEIFGFLHILGDPNFCKEGDIELLEEISEVTGASSLCALGKTAADPLRSTLRYFRDKYEANVEKVKSPALK